MTAAGEALRDEIRRRGPISFRRFMEVALYGANFGYYRRVRDPFGRGGDFYTAEQVQPAFGLLIARAIAALHREMGEPEEFTVVELGAGRQEMAPALSRWRYIPVDVRAGALPERFRGVVFSNEFFDALPVSVVEQTAGGLRERLVDWNGERFVWVAGGPAAEADAEYVRRYFSEAPEPGQVYEINRDALVWLERIAGALEAGFVLSIDYGYTRAESRRFPQGTLMSYRRHTAREDVLDHPGEQDLTAHVNFTALQEHGAAQGLETRRFETLAQALLAAGEADQFREVLEGGDAAARRLQLKTLLFGMGETFRVLLQRRAPK